MDKDNAKILLAEDEPSIRFVAERQLRALGYKLADIACDGASAVDKALKEDFDLIFMDVMMPELDGLSATKRLRAAGNKAIIVGMTAFAHKEHCLAAGMDDFIQKPVLLKQLGDTLNKWLVQKLSRETASEPLAIPGPDKFAETRQHLEDLQHRIHDLRKRSGLG